MRVRSYEPSPYGYDAALGTSPVVALPSGAVLDRRVIYRNVINTEGLDEDTEDIEESL